VTISFGTDGLRGDAEAQLPDPVVRAVGRAAARVLGAQRFVVGRDTRASGPRIEAALAEGLAAEGVRVDLLGVAPTPAVAYLAQHQGAETAGASEPVTAGAVISASHNPWADNGIKLFAPGGLKLSDETEQALESALSDILAGGSAAASPGGGTPGESGAVLHRPELVAEYRRHLLDTVELPFQGLRVVLDCANGAASWLAPEIFGALGATVEVRAAEPDGRNINEACGAAHPEPLIEAMRDGDADVGLAFDGDADRVIAVDERGGLVDGDHIIGMCAIDRRDRGLLAERTVVVTVMSNLGFRRGMAATGIEVLETPVGDRHVLEALDRHGLSLGGEQSGHVIFRDLATTGDGLLTGLQVCDLLVRTGRYLSDLATIAMTRYPQVLRNVRVEGPAGAVAESLTAEVAAEEQTLGGEGRILVRPSGTEPLVRIMVEAASAATAESVADRLAAAARAAADPGAPEAP
jgi:phosphoglucosamine mutase